MSLTGKFAPSTEKRFRSPGQANYRIAADKNAALKVLVSCWGSAAAFLRLNAGVSAQGESMRIVSCLSLLAVLATTSYGQGMTPPPPPPPAVISNPETIVAAQNVVIVSGTSSVAMTPDLVSVELGVITIGPSVRQLVDENTKKVAAIIALLKKKGVRPEMIKTSRFSLDTSYDNGQRVGYEAQTTIGVSSNVVGEVGVLVDAAIDSGANEIRGPEFGVENEKSVQDACVSAAFKDAKSKASRLASLSERRLGKVLAVTDGSSSPFELRTAPGFNGGVEGGALGGLLMEPGVHKVNCGVTVAFELE